MKCLLYFCFCLRSLLPDQKAVLMFMLKPRVASLPGHIQSVYVQNILKLYAYIMAKAENEVRLKRFNGKVKCKPELPQVNHFRIARQAARGEVVSGRLVPLAKI